jgi:Uma2 family endonuclease
MILDILGRAKLDSPLFRVLSEADLLGHESRTSGEDRLVMSGLSWDTYQQLDAALGQDRSEQRLYFLKGELEITATSLLHEKIKKLLSTLLEDYLYESGIEIHPHGRATLNLLNETGAEPDESWCLGEEKEFPDLVLEIVLTSGGIDKLEIYRRFPIPEIWLWQKGALKIWTLRRDRSGYEGPLKRSQLLPALDIQELNRCLEMDSWREARRAFRASWSK